MEGNNVLVIWNSVTSINNFELYLKFLLHNCDNASFDFAFDQSELGPKLSKWEEYTHLIVLCELTWDEKPYSNFYGIDLVKNEIRLQGINLPVLFLSFLSRKQILELDNLKDIISTYALGNHFIQLPTTSNEEIEKFYKMELVSGAEMEDTLNFISFDKIISTIRHDVNNENIEECKKRLKNIIEKSNKSDKEEYFIQLNGAKTVEEIRIICDSLEKQLPDNRLTKKHDDIKYKVLLLEDTETDGIKALINEEKNDLNIVHFKKTSEAFKTISEDTFNEFLVIIVDFRIWDNPVTPHSEKLMSEKQGYRFIEDVVKLGRRYTFVSFSEMPRAFRIRIASTSQLLILPEEKSLVLSTEEQRLAFINKLRYWAEQTQASFAQRASGNPVFIEFYNYYQSAKKEDTSEVDKISKEYIDSFNAAFADINAIFQEDNAFKNTIKGFEFKQIWVLKKTDDELITDWVYKMYSIFYGRKRKEELNELTLEKYLNTTDDETCKSISKNLLEWYGHYGDKKEQYTKLIREQIPSLNSQERNAILTSKAAKQNKQVPDFNSDLLNFINKLIARRLAIYIYYWLHLNSEKINRVISTSAVGNKPFGYINCVNTILTNWYLDSEHCYIDPNQDNVAPKTTTSCLWIENRKGRVLKLQDIGLTYEEEKFFENYYHNLYKEWKSKGTIK